MTAALTKKELREITDRARERNAAVNFTVVFVPGPHRKSPRRAVIKRAVIMTQKDSNELRREQKRFERG